MSISHYFRNLTCIFFFISLFVHSPIFLIKKLVVGALITKVSKEQPAILKSDIIRNIMGSSESAAKIKVKAIPTAPLSPPYINASTSVHFSPYPYFCNLGIKTAIERNLAAIIHKYNMNKLVMSILVICCVRSSFPKAL